MEKEIWRPVVGFEGFYEVSNKGRIRSLPRTFATRNGRTFTARGGILKECVDSNGYPCVVLSKNSISGRKAIHRILMEAFVDNPEKKPHIDHIDTNIKNYNLSNLRWVTPKENANNPITKKKNKTNPHTPEARKKRMETRKRNKSVSSPKEIHQYTKNGEYVRSYESLAEASRVTGIQEGCIRVARDSFYQKKGNVYEKTGGGFVWKSKIIEPR